MRSILRALSLTTLLALTGAAAGADEATVTVYRSPTCGCCTKWVDHLREAGFSVETKEVSNVTPVKIEHGVPEKLASCHTALVEGYVIEGHVPAGDIARLLAERPSVSGLAVPGMPIGSPGMEGPDPEHYRVLSFDEQGHVEVFSSHGP